MTAYINGRPWVSQHKFNKSTGITSATWSVESNIWVPPFDSASGSENHFCTAVIKDYVYIINQDGDVGRASIDSSGVMGSIVPQTAIPGTVAYANAGFSTSCGSPVFITKSRIYVVVTGEGSYSGSIFSASIASDGSLGTWSRETDLYNVINAKYSNSILANPGFVATNDRVYILGGSVVTGSPDTYYGAVYTAPVDSNGIVGSWAYDRELNSSAGKDGVSVARIYDRVYLIGGRISDSVGRSDEVQYADYDEYGVLGDWSLYSTSAPLDISSEVNNGGTETIVTRNKLYLFNHSHVYTAAIDSSGDFSSWTDTGGPTNYGGKAFATDSKIYLIESSAQVSSVPFSGGLNDYSSYINIIPTGVGEINAPNIAVSGIAETTPLVGWGDIEAPTTNGRVFGIATNPILADGNIVAPLTDITGATQNLSYGEIVQPVSVLSGTANTLTYGWGDVKAKSIKVNGVAATSIIAIGNIKPKQIKISAVTGDYCSMVAPMAGLSGVANTMNYGNANIEIKHSILNAFGDVSLRGSGHIKVNLPVVSGMAQQSAFGWGDVAQPFSRLSGAAVVANHGIGNIDVMPVIHGRTKLPETYEIIQYSRGCQ